MFQPHERTLSLEKRLTADLSEVVKREPPNGWFDVGKLDQEGKATVNVNENFLNMGGRLVGICWQAWRAESDGLASGKIPAIMKDFVQNNLDWYCAQIARISGFTPEQITSKIEYLQTHGGTDHFGRHLHSK